MYEHCIGKNYFIFKSNRQYIAWSHLNNNSSNKPNHLDSHSTPCSHQVEVFTAWEQTENEDLFPSDYLPPQLWLSIKNKKIMDMDLRCSISSSCIFLLFTFHSLWPYLLIFGCRNSHKFHIIILCMTACELYLPKIKLCCCDESNVKNSCGRLFRWHFGSTFSMSHTDRITNTKTFDCMSTANVFIGRQLAVK